MLNAESKFAGHLLDDIQLNGGRILLVVDGEEGYASLMLGNDGIGFGINLRLQPQRLMIPPDRKPHGSRIHGRILGHKYHQVGNKGCLWIDGTEPVGDTTENGIETGGGDTAHIDPCMSHVARQLRTIGQITVPYSGMMGTVVAQSVDGFHPTFQTLILRYTEAAGNALLCGHVSKVHKKFCQASERNQFQHLPCRRKISSSILHRMSFDKFLFCPFQFPFKCREIFYKVQFIDCQGRFKEPKWAMSQRKLMDNARPQRYLYLLSVMLSAGLLYSISVPKKKRPILVRWSPGSADGV